METLVRRIERKSIIVGIIGLGYVGLPLARAFLTAGLTVVGFDIDKEKVEKTNRGESYIRHISSDLVNKYVQKKKLREKKLRATCDFSELRSVDSIIICVPTPIGDHCEPDLQYIRSRVAEIARHLKEGQIIVLESTTCPGTTDEIVLPMLQQKGMKAG